MERNYKEAKNLRTRHMWERVLAIVLSVFMALSFTPAPAVHAASDDMITQDELTFGIVGIARFVTNEYTDTYKEYDTVHIYKGNTRVDDAFESAVLERQTTEIANVTITTKKNTPAGNYTFYFYDDDELCEHFVGRFTVNPRPVYISYKEGVTEITKKYSDNMTSDEYKANLVFKDGDGNAYTELMEGLVFGSTGFASDTIPNDNAYDVVKVAPDTVETNYNYAIMNSIPGVKVVKKPISDFTFTAADVVYKGAAYTTGDITKTWKNGNDVIDIAKYINYSFDADTTVMNAGEYNITATAKDDSYYTGSKKAKFSVTPKPITAAHIVVNVSNNEKTYNKSAQSPTITVTDNGTALVMGTDYTVDNYVKTNAGEYTLTLNGIGNYGESYVLTKKLIIYRATISDVSMVGIADWTYGDKTEDITPSVTGWDTTTYPGTSISYKYKKTKNSDGSVIANPTTVDINTSIPKNLAAGTYEVWAVINGGDNYTETTTIASDEFVVRAKPVNVTLGNINKYYGDTIETDDYSFTINTPAYSDAPSFANLTKANMEVTDIAGGSVVLKNNTAKVGDYSTDGNYVIDTITNGTYVRSAIPMGTDTIRVTFAQSAESFVFNGKAQSPTVTVTVKNGTVTETLTKDTDYTVGIYSSKDATVTVAPINVGTYWIKISAVNDNVKISGDKWLSYTITKASITIAYRDIDASVYNPNVTAFDMSDYDPTISVTEGSATAPTLASLLATNKVVYASVETAAVGENKALTFGYMDNDSFVAYSETNNALFNADANNNYNITFADATKTINKSDVTLTIANMPTSWQYLDPVTNPTITAKGANGEVISGLTYKFYYKKNDADDWTEATLEKIKALTIGTYNFKVTTVGNANYKAGSTTKLTPSSESDIVFSVIPKELHIKIQDAEKTYLERDKLSYKVYKVVKGATPAEDAEVEITSADELKIYIKDAKILLGRTENISASGEDLGENVGTHLIDQMSYDIAANVPENCVNITPTYGTLTINPLDLGDDNVKAKLLLDIEPEGTDNWVMGKDSEGKDRMMYLYNGQMHRPQMVKRMLQQSWKSSQEVEGVLGYYTLGGSGAYHYVLVPARDYIISFTDENGNQVSNPTDAGKYRITITNSNGSNNIKNSQLVQEFEIMPVTYYVEYTEASRTKTYNASAEFATLSVSTAKYGNADIIAADPDHYGYTVLTDAYADWALLPTSGTASSADAGVYSYGSADEAKKMTLDTTAFEVKYGSRNYKVEVVNDVFTISQKDATITVEAANKEYGSDDPEFKYSVDGLVDGETLEDVIVTRENKSEDVGAYEKALVAGWPVGKNTNYNITSTPGTFTITAKDVTVTANNATKPYGEADPQLQYVADGVVDKAGYELGDINISRVAGENAGTYDINVSATDTTNKNYNVTYKKGTFTINKAAASTTPSAANIKTTKATGSSKDASISGVNSSMEYSTDGGKTWTSVPAGATSISGLGAGTVLVRTKGDANHNPSNAVSVTIAKKASQSAPSSTAIKASASSGANGTITGVNDTMEYSTDGGKTWKSVPKGATSITGLGAGIVQIRKKATADSAASAITTIVIPSKSSKYKSEWRSGQWYNADGTTSYRPKGQWKKNSTGWWYEDTSGWYPKAQWQKIDGLWYYFNASGYMASSEWVDGYWVDSDGAWRYSARGSWKHDGTGWWFGDTSGWYAKNQWQKIDGTWYYFDGDGHMK